MELRRRVAVLGDAKRRSICCAKKTVSHVQRVVEAKSAFICRSKYREKDCHFDRACSMKPTIAAQRKSKAGFKIVQRYCDSPGFVPQSQGFQFLVQSAGYA